VRQDSKRGISESPSPPLHRSKGSPRSGAPAAMRVYRLAALTVGALIAARRRIGRASLSYRLRLRFVRAEHNMINCRLGSLSSGSMECNRQRRSRSP
jgi:hypothetical protein